MICVDSSVAAKWILPETHGDLALALVTDAASSGAAIIAPSLLPYEVANILRKRMLRESMPLAVADDLFAEFLDYAVDLTEASLLTRRALAIADRFGLPAVYDAHYLALAEQVGCNLWTDDQRLLRQVGGHLASVRWIGAYVPANGA